MIIGNGAVQAAVQLPEARVPLSPADKKVQKYVKALDMAMKNRDYRSFIVVLTKVDVQKMDKTAISVFIHKHKEALAKLFVFKRPPNKVLDKLTDKVQWPGQLNTMCRATLTVLDGNTVFKEGQRYFEDVTIFEIRKNPKSSVLAYVRLEKNPLVGGNRGQEDIFYVDYIETSKAARGKCLAYLLLNTVISQTLTQFPQAQVKLQDCSNGLGTKLYRNVGEETLDTHEEQANLGGAFDVPETWFTYTKKDVA